MKTQRVLMIAVVAAGLALALWLLRGVVRIERLLEHYGALTDYIRHHFVLALAIYGAVYVAVVVFSLPAASALTLVGGALFGGLAGGIVTVLAATIGATIIFLAARGLMHEYFVRKTGPWLGRLRQEFHADAASYLLILRLTPVFPFVVVNLAAALLGARLATYVWTTCLGIMPGTAAYSFVGSGLSGVLQVEADRLAACRTAGQTDCRATFDPSAFLSRDIALGLAGLALLVLVSLLARRYAARASSSVDSGR